MRRLLLTEYETLHLAPHELSETEGEAIYRRWEKKIDVEFPSPRTNHEWQLTPSGWVGFLPVTRDLGLDIRPKVPIANLLRMFEYAYALRSIEFHEELAGCATLDDFYSKLAQILSHRLLQRTRRGLYRGYIAASDDLGTVRGRVDLRRHLAQPATVNLRCDFEEHTSDLVENQILAWTMSRIVQSSSLKEAARPLARKAYHAVSSAATARPFRAADCLNRLYNRLNDDYQQLHLLSRFFLEHTGPTLSDGDSRTVPFVVNMARLFELFVAEWLRAWLRKNAPRYTLRWQDRATLGEGDLLQFNIDMVLHDSETNADVAVIDAKYKAPDQPSNADVQQIAFYAQLRDCTEAILVYPTHLLRPLNAVMPRARIRSLAFTLDRDLELAGQAFVLELIPIQTTTVE